MGRGASPRALLKRLEEAVDSGEQVDTLAYCLIWEELCLFMAQWGTLFKFVVDDVNKKVGVLRGAASGDKAENYRTLQDGVEEDVRRGKSGRRSAVHCILRLHRALNFVVRFFDGVHDLDDDDAVGPMARGVYKETLAPHHTWVVRRMTDLVLSRMPDKKRFVENMKGDMTDEEEEDFFATFNERANTVYERTVAILDSQNLR